MMTLSWHSKKLDLSDFRVRLQSVLSFTIQPAQFYARLKGDEISPSDFAAKMPSRRMPPRVALRFEYSEMLKAELREQGILKKVEGGGDKKSEEYKKSGLSTMDKPDSVPEPDDEQNLTLSTMDKVTHPEPDEVPEPVTEPELVIPGTMPPEARLPPAHQNWGASHGSERVATFAWHGCAGVMIFRSW